MLLPGTPGSRESSVRWSPALARPVVQIRDYGVPGRPKPEGHSRPGEQAQCHPEKLSESLPQKVRKKRRWRRKRRRMRRRSRRRVGLSFSGKELVWLQAA